MKSFFKKSCALATALFLMLSVFVPISNADQPNSVTVSTLEELVAVRNNLSGNYVLENNIVVPENYKFAPLGSVNEPFTGNFDGNGYSIINLSLTVEEGNSAYVGLFASNAGTVSNLNLVNVSAGLGSHNYVYLGSVAAINKAAGKIVNCYVSGDIAVSECGIYARVGGIVGKNSGIIENTVSEAGINYKAACTADIGGIAGDNTGSIVACENRLPINASTTPDNSTAEMENDIKSASLYVGGIVGFSEGSAAAPASIVKCISSGSVYADSYNDLLVGGILGHSYSSSVYSVEKSISTGKIASDSYAEGFYGSQATVSTGAASGSAYGTFTDCAYLVYSYATAGSGVTAEAKTVAELRDLAGEVSEWYLPTDEESAPAVAAHKVISEIELTGMAADDKYPCGTEPKLTVSVKYNDGTFDNTAKLLITEGDNKITYAYKTATNEYSYTIEHIFDKEVKEEKYLKEPATCTTPAVYYKSCVCGLASETETFEGDKLSHTYDKEIVSDDTLKSAATCTSLAVYYKSCECGEISKTETFTFGEKDAANHIGETEIVNQKAATCKEEGYTGDTKCKDCGEIIKAGEVIPKDASKHLGTTKTVGAKAATCTAKGYTGDKACADCGAVLEKGKETPALGHKLTTKTTKATLSANGKIVTSCTVCKAVTSTKTISRIKTVKLSTTSYTYSGSAKKPSVTVKDYAGKTLKNGTDYTVSYKNNKSVGTATATVTFKGNYSGSKKLTFTIKPKTTSLSKLTAGKKQLKVTWKKNGAVSGYQIQYSTSKKFTSPKTVTVKGYKTTSKTIKSLKAKKTYYVRIRTYKTVNGKKVYSDWSAKALSKKTK